MMMPDVTVSCEDFIALATRLELAGYLALASDFRNFADSTLGLEFLGRNGLPPNKRTGWKADLPGLLLGTRFLLAYATLAQLDPLIPEYVACVVGAFRRSEQATRDFMPPPEET